MSGQVWCCYLSPGGTSSSSSSNVQQYEAGIIKESRRTRELVDPDAVNSFFMWQQVWPTKIIHYFLMSIPMPWCEWLIVVSWPRPEMPISGFRPISGNLKIWICVTWRTTLSKAALDFIVIVFLALSLMRVYTLWRVNSEHGVFVARTVVTAVAQITFTKVARTGKRTHWPDKKQ